MITFPASILLAIFALIGLVMVVMIAVQLYHGYRFGRHDPLTMSVTTAFVAAVGAIVILVAILLAPVDWTSQFTFDPAGWLGGSKIQDLELPSNPTDLPSLFVPN